MQRTLGWHDAVRLKHEQNIAVNCSAVNTVNSEHELTRCRSWPSRIVARTDTFASASVITSTSACNHSKTCFNATGKWCEVFLVSIDVYLEQTTSHKRRQNERGVVVDKIHSAEKCGFKRILFSFFLAKAKTEL